MLKIQSKHFEISFFKHALPEVGVTSVGTVYIRVVDVVGVGGMNVTFCLLQLFPVQHSILQSTKVTLNLAKGAANSAHAASLSAIKR